jgi:hypothetical protein
VGARRIERWPRRHEIAEEPPKSLSIRMNAIESAQTGLCYGSARCFTDQHPERGCLGRSAQISGVFATLRECWITSNASPDQG